MLVKVQGTEYVRDMSSTALINKDSVGLEEYLKKRRLMASQKDEINSLRRDNENIKTELLEIKQLMLQLLEKQSNG
jgi:hypothetical protein